MRLRIQLGADPFCAVHQKHYPKRSTCRECREERVPTARRKKAATTGRTVKTPAKAVPFTCGCGRIVHNSAGICPGPRLLRGSPMTSSQKAKGDAFELSITRYLVTRGLDAVRTRAGYERDYGDVHIRRAATSVWPSVALQLKNHARLDLSGWLRGLPAQVAESKALTGALVVKRRGYGDPVKQYVVMELDAYLELLDQAGLTDRAELPTESDLADIR